MEGGLEAQHRPCCLSPRAHPPRLPHPFPRLLPCRLQESEKMIMKVKGILYIETSC